MKKICTLICFVSLLIVGKAQTFDLLTEDINPYNGGAVQFYKDLNEVLIKNNFKPCNNRQSEMFLADIEIVDGEGKIVNKKLNEDCATELFIKAFGEVNKLKKWSNKEGKQSKFSVMFYPIDYFANFKEGYTTKELKKVAEFKGGFGEFRNQLASNLQKQKIKGSNGSKAIIKFKIDQEGILNNITVEANDLDPSDKEKIIRAVENIKQKWTPETFRGQPVISSYQISIGL